eukprot:TRINITY_DN3454_c0_g1_i6.p1 TRINITY_DN3454_c0_g1~~TRINITY_DN3454_c0_g1_i6.p1  ORF type:complete len:242 (-),score=18.01 TRINITY_DN3454_c0_g1_i6:65-790(-)
MMTMMVMQEYDWDKNGYSFLNEFFPTLAFNAERKKTIAISISNKEFADAKNINTFPFRRSIWYYTDDLYGYKHDGFDSKEVNILLKKPLKLYIKKIATAPHSVSVEDMENVCSNYSFIGAELAHVALLTMEAKFHVELVYALQALQETLKLQRKSGSQDPLILFLSILAMSYTYTSIPTFYYSKQPSNIYIYLYTYTQRLVVVEFEGREQHLSLIHISEPTRRTPISYAVFCLKKKNLELG